MLLLDKLKLADFIGFPVTKLNEPRWIDAILLKLRFMVTEIAKGKLNTAAEGITLI